MSTIAIAEPHEHAEALGILLRHLPRDEREHRVQNTIEMIDRGEVDAECMLVARESHGISGAIFGIPLPGAGGICWPPTLLDCAHGSDLEDALVHACLQALEDRGSKIIQALLDPSEIPFAAPLLRNGFTRVTRLNYLTFSFSKSRLPQIDLDIQLTKYDEDRGAFEDALSSSFEETLDCPELNGIRSVEDVILGHHEYSDPERWWTAWRNDKPVGVLVLSPLSTWDGWELSYVGVVPSARRAGIGRQLTAWALHHVHTARVLQLNLAVDARNIPARNLYRDMGFQHKAHREVFLYFFGRKTL